ncbi:hypothetical protein [Marinicellulosiphila megalodicopiae]|uniref:hypothetical protein n=1 Tax=Marinicellulosiphila megalodicopiae TaxID=2724896 RepID=UPI003BB1F553
MSETTEIYHAVHQCVDHIKGGISVYDDQGNIINFKLNSEDSCMSYTIIHKEKPPVLKAYSVIQKAASLTFESRKENSVVSAQDSLRAEFMKHSALLIRHCEQLEKENQVGTRVVLKGDEVVDLPNGMQIKLLYFGSKRSIIGNPSVGYVTLQVILEDKESFEFSFYQQSLEAVPYPHQKNQFGEIQDYYFRLSQYSHSQFIEFLFVPMN